MKAFNFIPSKFLFYIIFLFILGCNSTDDSNNKTDKVEKDAYQPQTHFVLIKEMCFQPANLILHRGDTVIWTNKDIVAHDVTADDKGWHSNPLLNDSSFKKVIDKSEGYYCSIHVIMKGELKIEE